MSDPNESSAKPPWSAAFVNAVLGGSAKDSASRGRAAIPALLEVVANHCDACGAALWRQRQSDSNKIAIMGSWFRGTDDWLILLDPPLAESCSGRAILHGSDTTNDLAASGRLQGQHPFLIKHRILRAQSVKVELHDQWVGALTIYRRSDQDPFDDTETLPRLHAAAGIVPGLFRAALHQAELTLRGRIWTLICEHDEDDNADPQERQRVRTDTVRQCCEAIGKAFSSLEVTMYLCDLEKDGAPEEYRCFYTNDGLHKNKSEEVSYRRDSDGFSSLSLALRQPIHVRDTTDPSEAQEFVDQYQHHRFRPHSKRGISAEVLEQLRSHLPDGDGPLPPLSLIVSPLISHDIVLGFIRCWVAIHHGPRSYQNEDAQLLWEIAQPLARMIYDWRTADLRRQAMNAIAAPDRVERQTGTRDAQSEEQEFLGEALLEIGAALGTDGIVGTISLESSTAPNLETVACSGDLTEIEMRDILRQQYPVPEGDTAGNDLVKVFKSGRSFMSRDPVREPLSHTVLDGVRQVVIAAIMAENKSVGVLELGNRSGRDFPSYTRPLAESFGRSVGLRYFWFLAQRQRIEHQTQFNRAFSDASHQMKGPLSAAWKRLDLLLANNPSSVRTESLYPVRSMLRRAEFASKLVRLFGDIAAGRALQVSGRPVTAVDLVKLIGDLRTDAESAVAPSRELKLDFDYDSVYEHTPATLRLDQELFAQAIWNLIDNALKYSFSKTTIRINANTSRTGRFYLSVSNRGMSILASEVQLCKKRHWRKPEAVNYVGEGNGLGLYIVDEIMRAHGGSLDIIPTRVDHVTEVRLSFDPKLS